MCGRFTLRAHGASLAELFDLPDTPTLKPRYNISPTQTVAAVRVAHDGGRRELALLRWGLVPSWAKDKDVGDRLIGQHYAGFLGQSPGDSHALLLSAR